jgi:dihydrofolate synthase/folylpolyglutamate synthase
MLPARCERLRQQPLVIIDAAHNADSAQQLVASLGALYPGVRFTVVLGIVKGKDVAGIFGALAPFAEELILTNPQSRGKGSELDGLVSLAVGAGVRFRVQSEITSVDDLPRQANLLFTGSFFTALIGEKLFGPCPEAPA